QSKLRKNENGDEKQNDISQSGNKKRREALIKQLHAAGSKKTQIGEREKGAGLYNQNESGTHKKESNEIDPTSNEEEKELEADEKRTKDIEALKSKRLKELKISEDNANIILE